MGKYMSSNQLSNKYDNSVENYLFKVNVNIHGKRHTEKYSIPLEHLELAKELGLFKEDNGFIKYLDWKPIKGDKTVSGLHVVNEYYTDTKYLYAVTDNHIFSLPKYLEKDIVRKDIILYGKREY